MRFVDSNVFLHALLIAGGRRLTEKENSLKSKAKIIVKRIEGGEKVALTTVHLSEIMNLLESGLGVKDSLSYLSWVLGRDNIEIYGVTVEDYERALPIASEFEIGANDCLAFASMQKHGLDEIYSFDKHFDRFKEISRLTT